MPMTSGTAGEMAASGFDCECSDQAERLNARIMLPASRVARDFAMSFSLSPVSFLRESEDWLVLFRFLEVCRPRPGVSIALPGHVGVGRASRQPHIHHVCCGVLDNLACAERDEN